MNLSSIWQAIKDDPTLGRIGRDLASGPVAVGEAIGTLGTGLYSGAMGKLHGGVAALGGASPREVFDTEAAHRDQLQMLPQTEPGRQLTGAVGEGMGYMFDPFVKGARWVGDKALAGEKALTGTAMVSPLLLGAAEVAAGDLGLAGPGEAGALASKLKGLRRVAKLEPQHVLGGGAKEAAQATSRARGAVGENALVPRVVRELYDPAKVAEVVDFGSGAQAQTAKAMRDSGFNVKAHDFSFDPAVHDATALDRRVPLATASNVLNTQGPGGMMDATVGQLSRLGEETVANVPATPRKNGAFDGLTTREGADMVKDRLGKVYGNVEQVGGTPSAPVLRASDPLINKVDEAAGIPRSFLPQAEELAGERARVEAGKQGPVVREAEGQLRALNALLSADELPASGALRFNDEAAKVVGKKAKKAKEPKPPKPIALSKLAELFRTTKGEELRALAAQDLHLRPDKKGGLVGAPETITSVEDALAQRAKLEQQALAGADYSTWYEDQGAGRRAMNPLYADEGGYTSGINSNQASPLQELLRDAEIRIARASQGSERAKVLTKPNFADQVVNTIDVLDGKHPSEVGGLSLKTGTYAENQQKAGAAAHPREVPYMDPVIDTHMGTAVGHVVPEGQSTLSLSPTDHAYAKGEMMAVTRGILEDPEKLAAWRAKAPPEVDPLPSRVQASVWLEEKTRKVMAQTGMSYEEARASILAAPDSSFIKAAEGSSPSERLVPSAPWKQGAATDPLHDRLGLLQHPTLNPLEARPVWGADSFAEADNSFAGAHSSKDLNAQRLEHGGQWGKNSKGKPEVKGGRPYTREEHIAAGAVDQEQALRDLALLRQYAEGRQHGGLSWRGRDMPVELPAEAFAQQGTGAGTEAALAAMDRNPGFERLLGPEAFTALPHFSPATPDVMKGREILQKGGLAGLRSYVEQHGSKGLLSLPLLYALTGEKE